MYDLYFENHFLMHSYHDYAMSYAMSEHNCTLKNLKKFHKIVSLLQVVHSATINGFLYCYWIHYKFFILLSLFVIFLTILLSHHFFLHISDNSIQFKIFYCCNHHIHFCNILYYIIYGCRYRCSTSISCSRNISFSYNFQNVIQELRSLQMYYVMCITLLFL